MEIIIIGLIVTVIICILDASEYDDYHYILNK